LLTSRELGTIPREKSDDIWPSHLPTDEDWSQIAFAAWSETPEVARSYPVVGVSLLLRAKACCSQSPFEVIWPQDLTSKLSSRKPHDSLGGIPPAFIEDIIGSRFTEGMGDAIV
jgi:hypothetical protein